MALSPYIALPSELRLCIYDHLFQAIVYPLTKDIGLKGSENYCITFTANIHIIAVNRATRDEALPILERNVLILTKQANDLSAVPKFLRNATRLRVCPPLQSRSSTERIENFLDTPEITTILPRLKHLQCLWHMSGSIFWIPGDIVGLVADLQGHNIEDIVTKAFPSKDAADSLVGLKSREYTKLPFQTTVRLFCVNCLFRVSDETYIVDWIYLITIDMTAGKIIDFQVLMDRKAQGHSTWTSTSELLMLHDGLYFPSLYNPRTGQKLPASHNELANGKTIGERLKGIIEKELADPARFEHALRHAIPLQRRKQKADIKNANA